MLSFRGRSAPKAWQSFSSRPAQLHHSNVKLFSQHKSRVKGLTTEAHERPWHSPKYRQEFLDHIAIQLDKKDKHGPPIESLYRLSKRTLSQHGGALLQRVFNGSVTAAVTVTYPHHAWKPWGFAKPPPYFWRDLKKLLWDQDIIALCVLRNFMEDLGLNLGVRSWRDWEANIHRIPRKSPVHSLGDLQSLLRLLYPDHNWTFGTSIHSPSLHITNRNVNLPSRWDSAQLRRQFLDQIREQLGGQYDKLYSLSSLLLTRMGATALIPNNTSPAYVVMSEYPEHAWKSWLFPKCPRDIAYQLRLGLSSGDAVACTAIRSYIDDILESVGVKSPITLLQHRKLIPNANKKFLIKLGGIKYLIKSLYDAQPTKTKPLSPLLSNVRHSFWKDKSNCRMFLDQLKEQLGGSFDSLYRLTSYDLIRVGGKALLLQYGESVARLMMEIYPEHTWKPWKFRKTPHRFWYNLGAQLMKGDAEAKKTLSEYFTDLQNELGISDPSDWQEYVSHPDKLPQKIAKQLRWLGHLPFLLSLVYPEMGWKSAYNSTAKRKFSDKELPASYWNSKSAIKKYVDFLKHELGGTLESLYAAREKDFLESGAHSLLWKFNNSPQRVFREAYPDHEWEIWRFGQSKRSDWVELGRQLRKNDPNAIATVRRFVDFIAKKHGIVHLEDWYRVSAVELARAAKHFKEMGGLVFVLQKAIPNHKWSPELFKFGSTASQQWKLRRHIELLVPASKVKTN